MSFAIHDLSVLAYANRFTLWHYKAGADSLQAVRKPGYFDEAKDMLAAGDMVMVTAPDGGDLLCIGLDGSSVSATSLSAARWNE